MAGGSGDTVQTGELGGIESSGLSPGGYTAVVGLGVTGLACVRHLRHLGKTLVVLDSRDNPPGKVAVQAEHPEVKAILGRLDRAVLFHAERVVVSPGLDLRQGVLGELRNLEHDLCGELTLFAEALSSRSAHGSPTAPVVAVTGSNGKSTVVTMLAHMARQAGLSVALGGNLGPPALELLGALQPDIYILEVSSFQLEACAGFTADVAALLNISPDHMDRYDDFRHYASTKARLLAGAEVAVLNVDDRLVKEMGDTAHSRVGFSLDSGAAQYHCRSLADGEYLAVGDDPLLAVADLALTGRANYANALAALALADACGLPRAAQVSALRSFTGLPHRMQRIGEWHGVEWINDSKATNVGAALAALAGLDKSTVLIAGGQGKGADFSPLARGCVNKARAVIVFGEDAEAIEQAIAERIPVKRVRTLHEAVAAAADVAQAGECVLFAPACASFDAFSGFEQRGEAFRTAVVGQVADHG